MVDPLDLRPGDMVLVTGDPLNPMIAAAMAFSSATVVTNALRLRRFGG